TRTNSSSSQDKTEMNFGVTIESKLSSSFTGIPFIVIGDAMMHVPGRIERRVISSNQNSRTASGMGKADVGDVHHKEGKVFISAEIVARFHPCRQTETGELAAFRQVATKALQTVHLVGIGIAPAIETDLCRLAV